MLDKGGGNGSIPHLPCKIAQEKDGHQKKHFPVCWTSLCPSSTAIA